MLFEFLPTQASRLFLSCADTVGLQWQRTCCICKSRCRGRGGTGGHPDCDSVRGPEQGAGKVRRILCPQLLCLVTHSSVASALYLARCYTNSSTSAGTSCSWMATGCLEAIPQGSSHSRGFLSRLVRPKSALLRGLLVNAQDKTWSYRKTIIWRCNSQNILTLLLLSLLCDSTGEETNLRNWGLPGAGQSPP